MSTRDSATAFQLNLMQCLHASEQLCNDPVNNYKKHCLSLLSKGSNRTTDASVKKANSVNTCQTDSTGTGNKKEKNPGYLLLLPNTGD